jgi:hypothetical protein
LSVLFLVLVLVSGIASGQSYPPADDPRQIILRSAALDQRDLEIARNYAYTRRSEQRRLDASGNVKSVESKTHEVLVLYDRPYERLIAKDDKPLPPDQDRKEQRKLDQELEHRGKASEKDREKRTREEAKTIEDQKAMIREVADAYSFRFLGEEQVSGHDAWVIAAEPLPGYRPRSKSAKLLPNFRGKLWITKEDYRWARVEAEVVRTVSLGLVLARLQPGTQISMQQTRVREELWMPSTVHAKVFVRLALVKTVSAEVNVAFSNYRKFQSDSRVLESTEVPATPPR